MIQMTPYHSKHFAQALSFLSTQVASNIVEAIMDEVYCEKPYRTNTKRYILHLLSPQKTVRSNAEYISAWVVQLCIPTLVELNKVYETQLKITLERNKTVG